MASVDLELKKAFQELQAQVIETRDKVRQMDVQIDMLKRNSHHAKLTHNEIDILPENCNLYESVGRMFVKRDHKTIGSLLDDRVNNNDQKISSLEQNKSYHETRVKESENNLRELIAQKKAQ